MHAFLHNILTHQLVFNNCWSLGDIFIRCLLKIYSDGTNFWRFTHIHGNYAKRQIRYLEHWTIVSHPQGWVKLTNTAFNFNNLITNICEDPLLACSVPQSCTWSSTRACHHIFKKQQAVTGRFKKFVSISTNKVNRFKRCKMTFHHCYEFLTRTLDPK